jgi:hypothetical protein
MHKAYEAPLSVPHLQLKLLFRDSGFKKLDTRPNHLEAHLLTIIFHS